MYVDEWVERVKVGALAPDFTLKTNKNSDWTLSAHRSSVTVLLFYPQNETLVCTRQLCSVRDKWEDYLETKATIVGISTASPNEQFKFAEHRHLPIPLLSDPGRRITRIFSQHWLYPVNLTRTVVVIDAKGVVRNCDVMLRAFRPLDEKIITNIYAARVDAFNDKYNQIKQQFSVRNNR